MASVPFPISGATLTTTAEPKLIKLTTPTDGSWQNLLTSVLGRGHLLQQRTRRASTEGEIGKATTNVWMPCDILLAGWPGHLFQLEFDVFQATDLLPADRPDVQQPNGAAQR